METWLPGGRGGAEASLRPHTLSSWFHNATQHNTSTKALCTAGWAFIAFAHRFLRARWRMERRCGGKACEGPFSTRPPVVGPSSPHKVSITTSCSQVTGKKSEEQK